MGEIVLTVPPLFRLRQGVWTDQGVAKMLEEGDNRWVWVPGQRALYLNTETEEVIMRKEFRH